MYFFIGNVKIVKKWKGKAYGKYYTLKIYDISLVDFSVQADEFGRLDVTVHEINDNKKHLFPFQLLTDVSGKNLSSWLKGRTIPKNRRYVTQLLSLVGLTLNDTMGIIDMCKGLSVNDAYWVDDHTGKVMGMAPLFDHNLSLFAREMERDFPYFMQNSNSMFLPATGTLSFSDESRAIKLDLKHA